MRRSWRVVFCALGAALCAPATVVQGQGAPEGLLGWTSAGAEGYLKTESRLLALPEVGRLRAWHELLGSEPHIAGSPGDLRNIERLVEAFEGMGLEVRRHDIWPLLCRPVSASLEILAPDKRTLVLKENPLPDDPYTAHPEQTFGWNAYSGSGDVTSGVVYANYGTKADYAKLAELGVDVEGQIVIARYGGNFRGFKARFAEAAGARALIIFSDPADSGYVKGLMYPEGGYFNETCIERGSLTTMDYVGDPLTPLVEATQDAQRLDVSEVRLPTIPVQPVSWGAAVEIMKRMKGAAVPGGWQGGLPLAYRVSGGDELRVRLKVEQERKVTQTGNVIATLTGAVSPDQKVVVGCHHDAWGCGASDPLAGTITLLETARAFATLAKEGVRPARTLVFAAWGAEEFGIIGSSEWVEANRAALVKDAVAYINLDMASMGPDFASGASPSLRRVTTGALRAVPQARDSSGKSVLDAWLARSPDDVFKGRPKFGDLGGGSDHVGFLCHTGVPSAAFSAGGSKGTAYHSIYDTLTWYRKVVGEDYEPALMITRVATAVASRLSSAPVAPLDPAAYGLETRRQLVGLTTKAYEVGALDAAGGPKKEIAPQFARLEEAALAFDVRATKVADALQAAVGAGGLDRAGLDQLSRALMAMDRAWLSEEGLPGRPWFRNLYGAPDRDSGYASWMLPLLREAVEAKDWDAAARAVDRYLLVFDDLGRRIEQIATIVDRIRPASSE